MEPKAHLPWSLYWTPVKQIENSSTNSYSVYFGHTNSNSNLANKIHLIGLLIGILGRVNAVGQFATRRGPDLSGR